MSETSNAQSYRFRSNDYSSIESRSNSALVFGRAVKGRVLGVPEDNDTEFSLSDSDSILRLRDGSSGVSFGSLIGSLAAQAVRLGAVAAPVGDHTYGSLEFHTTGLFSSAIQWIKAKLFTPAVPHDQRNLVTLFGSATTEHQMLAKYNGAGVHVGIYDDGIDKSVSALMTHYDASRELIINGVKADPGVLAGNGQGVHGTATSGIIAADPTKTGGEVTGIANGAFLTAVNVFDGPASFFNLYLEAVRQMANFDVTSNSYGAVYKWSKGITAPYSYAQALADGLNYAGSVGRGGLGTVIVFAAGNDWLYDHRDANTDGLLADRHVVTVGAIASDYDVSNYATRGAAILTSAPSSGSSLKITTTDRTGAAGYSSGTITDTFGGTSAAAPEVAAVVADMLGANGKLGARDVQSILALASHDNELPFFAKWATGNMAYGWTVNHAGTFNGGGYHFSNDEGFGELNAHDAIREAVVWNYMNPVAQTFNNETHLSAVAAGSVVPATRGGATFVFNISGAENVENADLTLDLSSANLNNLKVVLTSGSGTQSIILDSSVTIKGDLFNSQPDGVKISLASHAFLGEAAQGTWTAQVFDPVSGDNVKINSATLDLYGSAPTQSHVFHYTDEAFKMDVSDWSRFTLHDRWGVDSWIDTAMMTGNESIDLHTGSASYENSIPFTWIGSDTIINKVALGDGACTVRCNDNGDMVVAGNGPAWITGGRGNDTFVAGSGSETISSGGGYDNFVFDHRGFGTATITDFTQGLDHIDMRGLGIDFSNLKIYDNGSTIWISNFDAQNDSVVLTNTHQQHLSAHDFLFA